MKRGDKGFVQYNDQVQLYIEVGEVNSKGIELYVINGGYTMQLDIVKVPSKVAGDYNEAIEWRRKNRKKKKMQFMEDVIKEKASRVDDEIPF